MPIAVNLSIRVHILTFVLKMIIKIMGAYQKIKNAEDCIPNLSEESFVIKKLKVLFRGHIQQKNLTVKDLN